MLQMIFKCITHVNPVHRKINCKEIHEMFLVSVSGAVAFGKIISPSPLSFFGTFPIFYHEHFNGQLFSWLLNI